MPKRGSMSRPRSRSKPKEETSPTSNPAHKPGGWLDWLIDHEMQLSWWMQEQGIRMFFFLWLRILEFSSNGICLIPAAAAAYLLPKESLTPEVRTFFFNLLGAFIVDLILVTLIKSFVCRAHTEPWSTFPSNHSTRALMLVTFFTLYLPMWKEQAVTVWLPFLRRLLRNELNIRDDGVHMLSNLLVSIITWLVYSWAIATTSSQIILRRHFFFEVLIGCALGILEGTLYKSFLNIPAEVSEGVHNYIFSFFARIWDAVMKLFNNGSFHVENVDFR